MNQIIRLECFCCFEGNFERPFVSYTVQEESQDGFSGGQVCAGFIGKFSTFSQKSMSAQRQYRVLSRRREHGAVEDDECH